ncbi:F0F1 ATP synthase subunit B [Lacticaseibacillus camelliae]|uniref:ATP synthase subunit b n=1 Tax=Lacticaseibacillus camelliae DSM 22697 = JCM 13995 TaxID=1423730 RepID=A0A0R2F9T4_9LACO|nr:F0F1 ATP synthase subunit B [Lacticaseibacillus camelliae]KRN25103.1 ATP synthase subunit b [Lacticaseibacillus camelliae DSM 22697 = JCM 13995]
MATFGDTLFLLAAFAVLVVLVGKFAWKPVTKIMADRQNKIDSDLDYADNKRQEAQKMADQREAELKSSKEDAVNIVNSAKENGEKQRATLVAQAQCEVATLKANANKDIAQQRADALAAAKNDVADLSLTIAEKLIAKELDPSTQQNLIDQYINELGDANGSH